MTPQDASAYAREICGLAPVIPVIVVHDVAYAQPLAEALVAGGLPVLEVTLRTPVALEVIRAMAEVPGGVVGAGTLLSPADVTAAKAAGALFGVSPGITDELVVACEAEELPLLGGIASISLVVLTVRSPSCCRASPHGQKLVPSPATPEPESCDGLNGRHPTDRESPG